MIWLERTSIIPTSATTNEYHSGKSHETINEITPPLTKLATFFLLALLALPAVVTAQTTVTSNGRVGETVCPDMSEINAESFSITEIKPSFIRYTTPTVTWNQYTGRLGDTTPPINVDIRSTVYDARTEATVGSVTLANINNSINYNGNNTPLIRAGLSAKTPYYLEVYAASSGSIPKQVFARSCFMTGGTYTMTVAPGTEGRNSGCFSISEFKGTMDTIQHVRNCWCGRKTTLPLFRSTQDNTDFLNRWGCR